MARAPLTLYLVRHGQMDFDRGEAWSVEKMNQYAMGGLQGGLSALGRSQAERVADRLEGAGITRIYTSSFLRAQETAVPLAQRLDLKPVTIPEAGELNPGAIEDAGIPARLFALMARESRAEPGGVREWVPPALERQMRTGIGWYLTMNYLAQWLRGNTTGGEGVREGYERVAGALASIVRANPDGGRVALFTHGYFIMLAIVHALSTWPPGLRSTLLRPVLMVPNGSITKLRTTFGGRLDLAYAVDNRHQERDGRG